MSRQNGQHGSTAHSLTALRCDESRPSRSRWYVRIPAKLLIFTVVTFFVLYPKPSLFVRHVERMRNLEAVIEPDAPQLAAMEADVRERLRELQALSPEVAAVDDARFVQSVVERYVYERVQYAWDWDLWGVAEYLPSISEMFEKAEENDGQLREDCDGRALLACSLMRRLGYEARLVADLRHMWVETPQGEWMGPGEEKTVTFDEEGYQIAYGTILTNLPISLSYGIAVFPFWREMIILLTAFALSLHPRMSRGAAVVGLVLLLQGLFFMRLGYLAPQAVSHQVSSWPAWVGMIHIAAGFAVLIRASHRARRGTGS